MRTSILLLFVAFLCSAASAQLVDDRNITIASGTDVVTKRQALINYIWGTDGFPSAKLPTSVVTNIPSPLAGLENLERVDLLRINETSPHGGRALHYVPLRKNGQVVVVHHGHGTTFAGTDALTDPEPAPSSGLGLRRTIAALLMDGYGVIAIYMPHFREAIDLGGGQSEPADGGPSHDAMFNEPIATGSAIKWFLEPTIVSLNHVQGLYSDYHMIGLSGGGWTTTICAAVDTRIRMSFPVAGTIPLYLRGPNSVGDTEQYISSFYSIAGYPDLYILGAHGSHRRQVQILNRRDGCCFGEATNQHNQGTAEGWTAAVREYERRVRVALFYLGPGNMSFRVEIDDAAPGHLVSWNAVIGTILAELNGGRRYSGASSTANAFVRGGDTHLYHRASSGAWNQTPFNVVGVAAAVENAVTPLDVFYRDNANRLRYAWIGASGWTSEALPLPANVTSFISDPAAVGTAGRWDVVAVGTDYRLYHWSSTGGGISLREVTGSAFVRGTPLLLSRAGGLDVVYRGGARTAYHARWDGTTWTTTSVGGLMQDFPAAAVAADGTLRIFVRGMSSQLWQASPPAGSGNWTWHSISGDIAGVPLIAGSPAAVMQNGTLTVYARNPAANLLMFTVGWPWSSTNVGGGITGSPTPTPAGPLVRGMSGGLWWYNGSGFVSMGGWFD